MFSPGPHRGLGPREPWPQCPPLSRAPWSRGRFARTTRRSRWARSLTWTRTRRGWVPPRSRTCPRTCQSRRRRLGQPRPRPRDHPPSVLPPGPASQGLQTPGRMDLDRTVPRESNPFPLHLISMLGPCHPVTRAQLRLRHTNLCLRLRIYRGRHCRLEKGKR